jgi:NAD(P)-dependent dehydrogenase (short-subunit alcohol dehydrogenase family)
MCLRAGCEMLHITTRFPKDCAKRLSKEKDWNTMKSRVRIYGLDLRHIPSVIKFCDYLSNNFKRLDIIINNAAQTIRRPPNFFEKIAKEELSVTWEEMGELKDVLPRDFVMEDVANLSNMMLTQGSNQRVHIEEESTVSTVNNPLSSLKALQEENNISASAILTMIPTSEDDHVHLNDPKHFPEGTDINNEQIDLRHKTTWTLKLHEVSLVEFMEVQTVNSTAPFVIVGKLREMMKRDRTVDKFIINVSSMEGQFYKPFKSVTHPHTNMAKASLNMMTRTSGLDYARDGIYMNSVDTGWVTNENASFDVKKFTPPLDEIDGAARVMDPIFESIRTKDCKHSLFYKDYKSVFW